MVTRSLVSYDCCIKLNNVMSCKLNGHQIIGELRPFLAKYSMSSVIEWSPDHW